MCQYLYFSKYLDLFKKSTINSEELNFIKYNNSHQNELNKTFTKLIDERIKMLDDMSYQEWLDYNNKNSTITFNKNQYYVSIYESGNDSDKNSDFILRASSNKDALNLSYSDLLRQEKYAFIFTSFAPNEKLISMMDSLTSDNNINNVSYYSLDYIINKAVKKHSIFGKWKKTIDDNESYTGIIAVGYVLKDVESEFSNTYYNYSNKYFLCLVSFLTFVAAIMLHYSKYRLSLYKPLSLLFILNAYLTYYYSTSEGITTFETEQNKFTDISSGVLSLSFLTGVNTYILDKLDKLGNNKFGLHGETSFYFLLAILLMLASLYKVNNYTKYLLK